MLIAFQNSNAQLYYDAINLRNLIDVNTGKFNTNADSLKKAGSILYKYLISPTESLESMNFAKIRTELSIQETENPFLKNYLPSQGDEEAKSLTPISSTIKSIGSLDVSNIADGFAKFIVKRTKQELSIAFFEKFKDDLDTFPDIRTVFPHTYRVLSAIDNEIYMYQAYIQTLRESFINDLNSLPSNLPRIIDNHKKYFDSQPDLKAILLTGFYFAQSIQDRLHPGNIIENFPIENLNDLTDPNISASFQTLILLSTSLKGNSDGDNYWVSYKGIMKLINEDDNILLKIFIGLLEQRAKIENIVFKDPSGKQDKPLYIIICDSYKTVNNGLPEYRTYIKNLALKLQSLETKISGLNKNKNDSLRIENYYSLVSTSIELMEYLSQVENFPFFPPGLNIQNHSKKYFDMVQTTSDIVIDVNRRYYSSAIVNGVYFYNLAFNKEDLEKYFNDKSIIKSNNETVEKYNNTSNAIFKYGSFMAAVAQAKNSDDMEAVVESFALPAGSSGIKRETNFNVALNAYCGLFAGHEEEKFSLRNGKTFNSFGVTAPIGLSVSWGHSLFPFTHGIKCGTSSTIFLSLIDLGAVTAFRFINDTTKTLSKIELKDIISPGILLSWGIPKSPVSVNLGYQITPYLRDINISENSYKPSYSRFSASVCVDIPLLNFYTKPR